MGAKVFIDGESGTTGLQIRERLAARRDLETIAIAHEHRRDLAARTEALNSADVVILCLPDDAAQQSVALISEPSVRVIDASSAHRTAPGWIYGFPELHAGQRQAIASASRVSNPGCWATGFIALVRPLVEGGLVPADWPLSVHGVSGYSGGGRGMIAEFEDSAAPAHTATGFRLYALKLAHKHLPEMQCHAGLAHAPLFSPAVGRFAQGMLVEVPLPLAQLPGAPNVNQVRDALAAAYADSTLVHVATAAESASLAVVEAESLAGRDHMQLHVFGHDGQARLVAQLDNLGKGASGAAVQNLNLMLGREETLGLR